MTRTEAEKFARSCLYNFREDVARLEQKKLKLGAVRQRGSYLGQEYRDRPGRMSARYVDSVPGWLEEVEFLEACIVDLELCVLPVQKLLQDLENTKQDALIVYKTRYERRMSWERAKFDARDEYGIGSRAFWVAADDLLERAIRYLDLPMGPETQPETQPEMRLENAKKAC